VGGSRLLAAFLLMAASKCDDFLFEAADGSTAVEVHEVDRRVGLGVSANLDDFSTVAAAGEQGIGRLMRIRSVVV
jgi:hypothetical protein